MYAQPFKVLAMHDMCGYGRSSLTAVSTILPTLNCQVCPLPTALLSHHYGFDTLPSVCNLGVELEKFLPLWQKMKLSFAAFYSGYLASPDQIAIAKDYVKAFRPTLVFVDPVLGDDGRLYHGFNENQIEAMRELVGYADIISPNLTEAAFLLNRPVPESITADEAKEMLTELEKLGPKKIIITGCHDKATNVLTSYAYHATKELFYRCSHRYIDKSLHGAGDSFASVIVGKTLQSVKFDDALKQASSYLYKCARLAAEWDLELCLEPPLPSLRQGNEANIIFSHF